MTTPNTRIITGKSACHNEGICFFNNEIHLFYLVIGHSWLRLFSKQLEISFPGSFQPGPFGPVLTRLPLSVIRVEDFGLNPSLQCLNVCSHDKNCIPGSAWLSISHPMVSSLTTGLERIFCTIPFISSSMTLDMDVSPFDNSKTQKEGVFRTYNPTTILNVL